MQQKQPGEALHIYYELIRPEASNKERELTKQSQNQRVFMKHRIRIGQLRRDQNRSMTPVSVIQRKIKLLKQG